MSDPAKRSRKMASLDVVELDAGPTQPIVAVPAWKTPAARARAIGGHGERLKSKVSTFNKATRGGLLPSKVAVIAGAPGAGKTTWTVQEGTQWASAGVHVAIVAADEEADGLLIRVGQQLGFDRDLLESGDAETRDALADRLEAMPTLMLVDTSEEMVTLEAVSEELERRRGPTGTAVLIVDSIQTVPVVGMDTADGPRARIDMVTAALKREAKQRRHIVIATCEMPRGAYRSQNASERIDDLAAFKESGAIEYAASIAMVMRSVSGNSGMVDVTMPKNRLGQKLPFRMELSFARASFNEVDMPNEGDESPVSKMKKRVLDLVTKAVVPIDSSNEIVRRLAANKKIALAAVKELVEEGSMRKDTKKGFVLSGSSGSEVVPGTA